MSTAEVSGGLVLPYAAITIAGKGGAAGILIITFMAVTSTLSAQVIAVSSIISFDIYRTYFNKGASDGDVIRWSHYGVVLFGVFSAAFSTALHYGGVDLGWTLYMLGKDFLEPRMPQLVPELFLIYCNRRPHLPWNFPYCVHHPLASPIHRRRYRLSTPRHGNRPRGLARFRPRSLRRRHCCYYWPNPPLRLRHCSLSIQPPPLQPHPLPRRPTKFRLGGLPQRKTCFRAPRGRASRRRHRPRNQART